MRQTHMELDAAHWTVNFETGHAVTWSKLKKRSNAIKHEVFPGIRVMESRCLAQPAMR